MRGFFLFIALLIATPIILSSAACSSSNGSGPNSTAQVQKPFDGSGVLGIFSANYYNSSHGVIQGVSVDFTGQKAFLFSITDKQTVQKDADVVFADIKASSDRTLLTLKSEVYAKNVALPTDVAKDPLILPPFNIETICYVTSTNPQVHTYNEIHVVTTEGGYSILGVGPQGTQPIYGNTPAVKTETAGQVFYTVPSVGNLRIEKSMPTSPYYFSSYLQASLLMIDPQESISCHLAQATATAPSGYRYFKFVITKTVDGNNCSGESALELFQFSWNQTLQTNAMTSDTTGTIGGYPVRLTASTEYSTASYGAWRAMDGLAVAPGNRWSTMGNDFSGTPGVGLSWFTADFGAGNFINLDAYKVVGYHTGSTSFSLTDPTSPCSPTEFHLEGSNDASVWTPICGAQTGQDITLAKTYSCN